MNNIQKSLKVKRYLKIKTTIILITLLILYNIIIDKEAKFIEIKKKRKQIKKTEKRTATAQEVIFIFEKVLEKWRTVKIYNTIIQSNPSSEISKKNV